MIDDLKSRPIIACRQMSFGHRHTDAIAEPLAERTCGGFHARRQLAFGMTRSATAPLAKLLNLLKGKVVSREKKHAVEQHGAVTSRQDETVTIPPVRVAWIMLEKARPQSIGGRRQSHGRAGVSGVGLLNGVHRQHSDRINAERV